MDELDVLDYLDELDRISMQPSRPVGPERPSPGRMKGAGVTMCDSMMDCTARA